jgi:hypothetical protein
MRRDQEKVSRLSLSFLSSWFLICFSYCHATKHGKKTSQGGWWCLGWLFRAEEESRLIAGLFRFYSGLVREATTANQTELYVIFSKTACFFPILYFLLLIIPSHSKTFHTLSFSFFLIIFIFILVLFLSLSCSEKGLEMFKLVLHYFLNYYCAH